MRVVIARRACVRNLSAMLLLFWCLPERDNMVPCSSIPGFCRDIGLNSANLWSVNVRVAITVFLVNDDENDDENDENILNYRRRD